MKHVIKRDLLIYFSFRMVGRKRNVDLLLLVFNFALEYASRKVQEDQARQKFNRKHQVQVYANDVLVGGGINRV